jgi:hypothetical protein
MTSPIPDDVLDAIAALPDARREALVAWLRGALGRMTKPPRVARPRRRPAVLGIGEVPNESHTSNPAWLGHIDIDDFGGNAA